MLFFNVRNSKGFTLIEVLTVLLIIGILSAIAVPSFLALLNQSKVNSALSQVQGTLQQAQRQAIRNSKPCRVTINPTANEVTANCSVTSDRTLASGVAIQTNLSGQNISFGIRGTTPGAGIIVLFMPDNATQKKLCIATSVGIGIMRTGVYSGSTSSASDITAGTCATSQ